MASTTPWSCCARRQTRRCASAAVRGCRTPRRRRCLCADSKLPAPLSPLLQARAALLQQLDRNMTHYSELYQPCPVEEFLSSELGVWSYNVMLFAVQHPALQKFSLDSHVKPAVRSLKAAGLDHTDIWFVITKRLELLSEPISLQRWLDFMAAQVSSPCWLGKQWVHSKWAQCMQACMRLCCCSTNAET